MSLEIAIWNVNHGNSTSVKLPNGKVLMFDCAENPETGFSPILQTMNRWNIDELDYLVVSHPHKDHISDILNISKLKLNKFRRPYVNHERLLTGPDGKKITGNSLDIINKYIELDKIFTVTPEPTDVMESPVWSGQEVKIDNFRLNGEQTDLNDYSSVTFLTYGSFHFAYAGDLTSTGWEKLIDQEGTKFTDMLTKVNFFEASHHGRKEGFNAKIFDHMKDTQMVFVSDKEEQDTSVTDRYSNYCKGWDVYNQNTKQWMNDRKVVTTRNDGRILIQAKIASGETQVGVYTL